jgi:hypothetical protein
MPHKWSLPFRFLKLYILNRAGHGSRAVKAYTVFARSEAGIMGSNPTQGMDVRCAYVFNL